MDIDEKLRKIFNAVCFLVMARNPGAISSKLEHNRRIALINGLTGNATNSFDKSHDVSPVADGASSAHLTESSPLKTCSTSSRIGRYQSDLSMIQRHNSSLVQ